MSDDFDKLARDLTAVGPVVNRNAKKALEVTARHVKDDWQEGAQATGLEGYARSVDYDIRFPGGAIEAEIGPNLGKRQGMFGLVEDATGDVRSAPQHAGRDALEANEDDFERGLDIAIADAFGVVWD